MKSLRLLLASVIVFIFMGVSNTAMAQITIGTGTSSTTSNPITSCYGYSYTEQIYLQSEISAAGTITSISFYVNALPASTANSEDWTIYLGHTTQADYSSTTNWVGANNMTQAYTGTVTYPAAGNWMTLTLTTPFVYNNTDNLVVGAYENTPGYNCSVSFAQTPTTAVDRSIYFRSDVTNPDPLAPPTATATTTNRANIQFGGISQACPAPTALLASNITTTGATLGWTAGGTETNWNIEYGATGFTQGSGTTVAVTANTYALSTLSVNTAYSYYVRAVCGVGDSSLWAGPFSFTTPCVAFTVPYFEGFEAGYTNNTAVAGCLSQENVTGGGFWIANNTFTTYNRAPRTGGWNAFLQYGNEDWIYIPIDLTGGTSYTFGAYARQDGATATNSDVTISYGTANNAAAMTNTIVATTGIINGNYQLLTGSFTPTTTGTYYIGIKGYMNGSPWYISLDDISVIATPNCPAPNTLTASNIAATSADLAWVGTGASFEVQYGAAGFTLGTGMMATSATNTASVTGFTFETNYDFYVRAVCAPGDTSPWSGVGSFFTGYCMPAPSSVDGTGIVNVTMDTLNNTTGAETGNYGNYSMMVADATQGGTLPIDITLATGYTYDMWAWIDWNNDLDFTDAGEEFFLGTSAAANPTIFSSSIAIPATALGNYRIRIGGADGGLGTTSPSDPCYSGSYGAFEDYTLNVVIACAVTSSSVITNANCFGGADGSIAITATGGIAPYTYLWNDGQTTATATGLIAAAYDVTITDANGCSFVSGGSIGQPLGIALTTISASDTLSASVGTALVVATGGIAPYTYSWSDGQTTDIATGLAMGTYTVTVTDANGCTETETVIVDDFVGTTRIDYITNLSIYPNPTNGNTVIDLELSQNADIAVSIYTITGILVQDFGKENTSKATHTIDVSNYSAGMYLVRFVVDNQVVTKKLLVTK